MAKVKIQGNASGTGVLTVTAPNTSTDRTITLPDESVTLGAATPSIDDNGDATVITINSSEDVLINTTQEFNTLNGRGNLVVGSGSGNEGITIYTGTSNTGGLTFADGTSGSQAYEGQISYEHSDNSMRFAVNGGTERMRILSSGGITFNGDTAAANALDDYEEGTWTVGWTSTSNTFNPSTTTGYYTKVGNLVTISYHAYLSGAPTINASANGFSFTGLPFTSSSGKSSTITWGHKRWMEWPSNTTDVMLDIEGASTTIQTLARTSIGELYNIRAVTFSRNGSGISFAGHYYTDS